MPDTTTQGHGEAVKAVTGQLAPETPEEQVADGDAVVVTRDLDSEQKKTEKLVKETEKGLAKAADDEQKPLFQRTLANGKTEAVLSPAPPLNQFPPDDGGYNPEKRTHAGPAGTMTPQAADAHRRSQTAGAGDVPPGWREEERV